MARHKAGYPPSPFGSRLLEYQRRAGSYRQCHLQGHEDSRPSPHASEHVQANTRITSRHMKCLQGQRSSVLAWNDATCRKCCYRRDVCAGHQNQQPKEILHPTTTPELPWYEIGTDIFAWEGQQYLVTIDCYSKYIEVDRLRDLSTTTTIDVLQSEICRHSIPMILRSDNGAQFVSQEFTPFCTKYNIMQRTSSPAFPQADGKAERAVQTVKRPWKKGQGLSTSEL